MGYEIELQNISIPEYKEMLKKQNLMAGRRILKEDIDNRFGMFFKYGINNVAKLYERIRDPQKMEEFSAETGLSPDYLLLLKKEVSSVIQKPVLIADFPYISPDTFKKLGEYCIQTSKDFFELSNGGRDVRAVCDKTGIPGEDAAELCCLCELIRINGVGPVFSRVLFEAGYKSAGEIAAATADEIYDRATEINALKCYTRVLLNQQEIQLCIDYAKLLVGGGELFEDQK